MSLHFIEDRSLAAASRAMCHTRNFPHWRCL